MKRSVLVTGVSGTGKSAISETLRQLGYSAYDLEEVSGLYTMFDKTTGLPMTEWDNEDLEIVKKMKWMCDTEKLADHIFRETSELTFYCGAAENTVEMMHLFDKTILLTADTSVIRERLSSRTSNDFGRTKEVQDLVMGWKDRLEGEIKDHGALVVDSNDTLESVAMEIIGLA